MSVRFAGETARRALLAGLGVLSTGLAFVGIFVPGMPTTVFVLAAAYLFARSSPALETWLHRHRWLGPVLHRFADAGGMTPGSKAIALASMWVGLTTSLYVLSGSGPLQAFTVLLGLIGTGAILFGVTTVADRQTPPAMRR
jgi:uncharacterized protein